MEAKMVLLIGFLAITVLTAVFVLLANIGLFGETVRTSDFSKWGTGAVLVEIVGTTVAVFKWTLLPANIKVSLDFSPKDHSEVDLDLDQCTYKIREGGRVIKEDKADVGLTTGGWQCTLPSIVRFNHVITLNLIEKTGQPWKVGPFYPVVTTQKAIPR